MLIVDQGVGTMPPHCDSLDGPVLTAARRALQTGNVDLVLPFVHADGEAEVRATFERVIPVRELGAEAREIADRLFFETVVRIHRTGEGAAYTGLKPAGLSVGPVIPLAERAIEQGSSDRLADFLSNEVRDELRHRLDLIDGLADQRGRSLEDERRYVSAVLAFQVYSHHLHVAIGSAEHDDDLLPSA